MIAIRSPPEFVAGRGGMVRVAHSMGDFAFFRGVSSSQAEWEGQADVLHEDSESCS